MPRVVPTAPRRPGAHTSEHPRARPRPAFPPPTPRPPRAAQPPTAPPRAAPLSTPPAAPPPPSTSSAAPRAHRRPGPHDAHRLRRRLDGGPPHARGRRPHKALTSSSPRSTPPRPGSPPAAPRSRAITYPGGPARHRAPRRHRRRDPRPPGRDRRRRDRLGQDHPAAQDLPRAGPRRRRADRPHPAAPARRAHASPSGSPRSWAPSSATPSATRSASPTRSATDTLVKLMTDGILLAELAARPRCCRRYDTLIIDEAHERSLNIDFILGYLTQLLPRRPDLKVIITSATIDTERFAAHFDAPVVEVTGRIVPGRGPLPARRRPRRPRRGPGPRRDRGHRRRGRRAAARGAAATCSCSCPASARSATPPTRCAKRNFRDTEMLPLYARLSTAEQHRVFAAAPRHAGSCSPPTSPRRRSPCRASATSSTPASPASPATAGGSRCSGCRSSRSRRPRPTSAPGRCGRVADGICIRLYAEDDFDARPEFTDPEILRTNLASVILQMTALGLGDLAAFPFVDPPDLRAVGDGVALLDELGALEHGQPAPAHGRRPARSRRCRSTRGWAAWSSRPTAPAACARCW